MNILKRNIPFLFLFVLCVFCFLVRNRQLNADLVSHPDTQITFTAGDILTQSWSPHTRKISGILLPYFSDFDFSANLTLAVFPDSPNYASEPIVTVTLENASFHAEESGILCFSFDTLTLIPGNRYLFCFSWQDTAPEEAFLLLPSGTQYDGCILNGDSLSQALAMQVSFMKNSHLFWLCSILFPVLSFALFLMLIFQCRFEEAAAPALASSIGILYLAGLMEHLEGGITFLYILSLSALMISICLYNSRKVNWKTLLSPGFFVFMIMIPLILIYNNHMYRTAWDEYSHWGLAVKDMFYYGSFAKHAGTTVMLPWYPPFITLFQYFLEYQNGIFSENLLYVAFQLVLLCFSLPIFREVTWKRLKYLLPAMIILLFVPVIFFPKIFSSIYVDPLLAVFMAYTLFCYYTVPHSLFRFLRITAGLFALTLTKEMGAPIAGLLVIIFFLDTLYQKRRLLSRSLLSPCTLMLVVFACFFSWRIYLAVPAPSFSDMEAVLAVPTTTANFTLRNILDLFTGNAPSWRYLCIRYFIEVIFSRQTYSFGVIGLSILDICFLLLLAALLLPHTRTFHQDKRLSSLCVFGVLCAVPYLGFLLFTYLFAFSTEEALMLHSYYRYAGSYIGGLALAFACYTFFCILKQEETTSHDTGKITPWKTCLSFTLVLCIITPAENFVIKDIYMESISDSLYGCDEASVTLRSFADRSEHIYLVCNNNGFRYYAFRNALSPLCTQNGAWDLYSSRESLLECYQNYPDLNYDSATILSSDDWARELSTQYEYVFLLHPNEMFGQMYGELFEDPSTLGDGTFYKVMPSENGRSILSYIGKVGVKQS